MFLPLTSRTTLGDLPPWRTSNQHDSRRSTRSINATVFRLEIAVDSFQQASQAILTPFNNVNSQKDTGTSKINAVVFKLIVCCSSLWLPSDWRWHDATTSQVDTTTSQVIQFISTEFQQHTFLLLTATCNNMLQVPCLTFDVMATTCIFERRAKQCEEWLRGFDGGSIVVVVCLWWRQGGCVVYCVFPF